MLRRTLPLMVSILPFILCLEVKSTRYVNYFSLESTSLKPLNPSHLQTMPVMLSLVDAFASFGILRKEPVLVMGGGMVTDVVGVSLVCLLIISQALTTSHLVRMRILPSLHQLCSHSYYCDWAHRCRHFNQRRCQSRKA